MVVLEAITPSNSNFLIATKISAIICSSSSGESLINIGLQYFASLRAKSKPQIMVKNFLFDVAISN